MHKVGGTIALSFPFRILSQDRSKIFSKAVKTEVGAESLGSRLGGGLLLHTDIDNQQLILFRIKWAGVFFYSVFPGVCVKLCKFHNWARTISFVHSQNPLVYGNSRRINSPRVIGKVRWAWVADQQLIALCSLKKTPTRLIQINETCTPYWNIEQGEPTLQRVACGGLWTRTEVVCASADQDPRERRGKIVRRLSSTSQIVFYNIWKKHFQASCFCVQHVVSQARVCPARLSCVCEHI